MTRRSAAAPLYAQIAGEFRGQIDKGVLRSGDKLPSIRALRRGRRVSAATVMEAYLRLERDGYVRARDRSGFYVAQPATRALPEPQVANLLVPPVPVGINELAAEVLRQVGEPHRAPLGVSSLGSALLPAARLNRAFRRAAARWPQHSASYGLLRGQMPLRRQIARRALIAGSVCDPEDVIITGGGMDALNLALRAVARPGDVIAVESPTYFGILQILEGLGLRAIEVPADPRHGIDLDLLDRALRRHRPKAVVAMTTCHNPLGSVMSETAKADLVALTAKHDTAVIEDAVYAELLYDQAPQRAAKAFDKKGLVLFCGSFSKVLAPGLRVGWIEAGRFRDRVEVTKSITSLVTSTLPQLAVTELMESGFYDRYINRIRTQIGDQTARYVHALSDAFPAGTRMTRPAGGNLVWVQLPDGLNGTILYRRARAHGNGIFPGEIFSADAKHRGFVRISCGAPWSPVIERAITTLGRLCRDLKGGTGR